LFCDVGNGDRGLVNPSSLPVFLVRSRKDITIIVCEWISCSPVDLPLLFVEGGLLSTFFSSSAPRERIVVKLVRIYLSVSQTVNPPRPAIPSSFILLFWIRFTTQPPPTSVPGNTFMNTLRAPDTHAPPVNHLTAILAPSPPSYMWPSTPQDLP